MKNDFKQAFSKSVILVSLFFSLGITAYMFRYEFGISKPLFKEGDCVYFYAADDSYPIINKIIKVHKATYTVRVWNYFEWAPAYEEAADQIDTKWKQIDCIDKE